MNGGYKYFGGTSMSNPIAGGAATVVRDFYQKTAAVNASAALVKATLINSAVDLPTRTTTAPMTTTSRSRTSTRAGAGSTWPTPPTAARSMSTRPPALSTGGSASYQAAVTGAGPLKVSAGLERLRLDRDRRVNLVNDLNLTVTAPNGDVYRGNVFSGGWSQTGGSADRVNNVENVYIQTPAAGTLDGAGQRLQCAQRPAAVCAGGRWRDALATPRRRPGRAKRPDGDGDIQDARSTWPGPITRATRTASQIERCTGCRLHQLQPDRDGRRKRDQLLEHRPDAQHELQLSGAGRITRPAISAYSNTASATTLSGPSNTGLLSPTAQAAQTSSAGDNNGFQTNPANANANDSVFAVDTNSGTATSTSCTNNGKDKHSYSRLWHHASPAADDQRH